MHEGFTRRIVGVPRAESEAVLSFLFHQIAENTDAQVRFKWRPNSIAIWDNRVRTSYSFPRTSFTLRLPRGSLPSLTRHYTLRMLVGHARSSLFLP